MGGIFDLAGETIEGWGVDCGGVTHITTASRKQGRKDGREQVGEKEGGEKSAGKKG